MTDSTRTSARKGGKGLTVGIGVGAVLTVAGIALWAVQLSGGMVQTGMRNMDSWGLYITMFMFFVGLSAGGLIISSIPRAFGMQGFGGISKVAVWTSICCTVLAIGFVVVDLGQPLRVWELFAYSNLGSPLMWDIVVLFVYLILSAVYLWATLRAEAGKVSQRALRAVSVVALVCAVLVHSVTAWIFGLQQAHEFWHTAILAPWFVSSALVCGTALVLVVAIALRRAGYLSLDQSYVGKPGQDARCVRGGGPLLLRVRPAYFRLSGSRGRRNSGHARLGSLGAVLLGGSRWLCPAAVMAFVPKLRTNPLVVVASLLAIVGIFCKRVQLLVGGFQIPNLDLSTVMTSSTVTHWEAGMQGAYQGMVYVPTILELGVTLGVVGLGVLLLCLGLKYLPLRPAGDEA